VLRQLLLNLKVETVKRRLKENLKRTT